MTRHLGLAILASLVLTPVAAYGQDTEWNRYTLEDLGGVFVRMEVAEPCAGAGITASTFEADVSMALIDSDVGVLTREEMLERPALPELRVTIDCAPGTNGTSGALAYSVELRVQQSAQMLRDTQITLPEAVTWYSSRIGVAEAGQAVQAVESALTEQIETFVTAWTEINTEGESS